MSIKESAIAIYAALKAVESDLEVVAALSGMAETVEFISLKNNVDALHSALNGLRKLLGMTWSEFLAFIGEEPESAPAALSAPSGGGAANVGGSGVIAFSGGTNKDNPPPPPGGA